jgi:hypothetical protein
VRIVVYMLLDLERCTLLLHLHTDDDVQVFSLSGSLLIVFAILVELRCIGVLYIVASMATITLLV